MNIEENVELDSETIAFEIAGFLSSKQERFIDHNMVFQYVKERIKDEKLIDEVFRATISLLESKYGILFDVDKKIDI